MSQNQQKQFIVMNSIKLFQNFFEKNFFEKNFFKKQKRKRNEKKWNNVKHIAKNGRRTLNNTNNPIKSK